MVAAAKPFFDVDFRPGVIPPWRADLAAERLKQQFGIGSDPSITEREARLFAWLACWRGARAADNLQEYERWVDMAATLEPGVVALGAQWGCLTLDASYALGDLVGAICEHIRATMPEKLKPENGV